MLLELTEKKTLLFTIHWSLQNTSEGYPYAVISFLSDMRQRAATTIGDEMNGETDPQDTRKPKF